MELTIDKIPVLMGGTVFYKILKPNLSDAMFHCTPSAPSTDQLLKSRFLTVNALLGSGKASTTFLEFDTLFVSLIDGVFFVGN